MTGRQERAREQIDQTMKLFVDTEFDAVPPDDVVHIGVIGWTLLATPPKDTETAVGVLRFVYQLGRDQGRRDKENNNG